MKKGLGILEGFLDRFKFLGELDENKVLQEVLDDKILQAQIIDLNQKQLYEEGKQADGEPTGEYHPKTIAYKLAYGDARQTPGRIDHITGVNTGRTFASMAIDNQEKQVVITVDDRNKFFEVEKHGLGLTEESLEEVRPEILERVINLVESKFEK